MAHASTARAASSRSITAQRSDALIRAQPAISSMVRPHPVHRFPASSTQTLMQGDAGPAVSITLTPVVRGKR